MPETDTGFQVWLRADLHKVVENAPLLIVHVDARVDFDLCYRLPNGSKLLVQLGGF